MVFEGRSDVGRCAVKRGILWTVCLLFFFPSILWAQELVTGAEKKFNAPDRILFHEDFSQCPVGEIPEGFDAVRGTGECVRYGDRIWFTSATGETVLIKKVPLGEDEFAVVYDLMFLKGQCAEVFLRFYGGEPLEKNRLPCEVKVGPGCSGEAVYVFLEGAGRIHKSKTRSLKRNIRVAVQVRRKQLRVYVDGKRLARIPFQGSVHAVGFFLHGDYAELLSNLIIGKYRRAEARPSPEKLGISVEKNATETKLTLPERVLFEFNRFFLKPESKEALDLVADILTKESDKRVHVIGYTDDVGSEAYNLRLSLQRAQSVADYLVYVKGIDPKRITIEGKGEAHPVASNETEEGRAQNRRVEIILK